MRAATPLPIASTASASSSGNGFTAQSPVLPRPKPHPAPLQGRRAWRAVGDHPSTDEPGHTGVRPFIFGCPDPIERAMRQLA
jgi:hypothetical protein